ncbi:MAG: creatininase family protein [Streptosporangiales bacterium]|nr:creatininase family protein [Streptosporangiales bacterium]
MSWPKVREALDNGVRTAIFAVGSTEQHGPHLPLQTDALLGEALVAELTPRLPNTVMAPTIPLGVSTHHMAFPGTLTLDTPTFLSVVEQCVASLAEHGFTTVLVVPSHGGNFAPLRELYERTGGTIGGARFLPYTDLLAFIRAMEAVSAEEGIAPEVSGAHAGESETSLVLALRPDLVDMDAAVAGFDKQLDDATAKYLFEHGTAALTDVGVLGDARAADAERGHRYLKAVVDLLYDYFEPALRG